MFHAPYLLLFLSAALSFATGYVTESQGSTLAVPLALAGLALGIWAKKELIAHRTPTNPYGTPSALVKTGPFRWSRNPMYLSYALIAFAAALAGGSWAAFIWPILYLLFINTQINREEERLAHLFPEEFSDYRRSVRKWI